MKWKRIIAWTAATILGLIVVAAIAGYFVLRSQGFHQYVLAKIVQQSDEATGGKVEVSNFDFHFKTLTADLYGFTIHGTEPLNQKPLLHVDRITIGLKIISIFHHRVNLRELLIEHPVAHLVVDKNGRNNIPEPTAPNNNSSQTNVFDLAVGHVLLSNGEIDYNDRKSAINADVRDLRAETHFNYLAKSYDGSITYHDGRLEYAGTTPLPHALNAQFSATPSTLNLSSLVLTVGSSRISLQATVNDYSSPAVHGSYNALLHTQDIATFVTSAQPAGDISLSGKLSYQSIAGHSFLKDIVLDGQLDSELLGIASPAAHVEFRKLHSQYQLANGTLQTRDFVANLLDGQLRADVSVADLDTTPASKLHVSLREISLEKLKRALHSISANTVPLAGTLDGSATASWTGSLKYLQARSDFDIHAATTNTNSAAAAIPVNGDVHIIYDAPRNILTVHQTTIRTPSALIVADGQISKNSSLELKANVNDLRELALLAMALQRSSRNAKPAQPFSVSGSATLIAVVTGSLQDPIVNAQATAQNLNVEGSEWKTLALRMQATSSSISVQNGSLVSAHQGELSFSGSAGLRHWSYLPSSAISINASVRQMPIVQLAELARVHYPIDGNLSGDITIRGSQLNPAGSGFLQLTKAHVSDEPIQALAVKFQASNGTINSSLNASLPAGSATATLTFVPKTKAYKFQLNAPGIVLSRLHAVQNRNLALKGTLTVSASGAGTLDNPNLTATIEVPQLQIRQNSITGLKAEVNVANQRADLSLSSDIAQATIRAHATVNLTGDYYADAVIDTSKIPLGPLLAMYAPGRPDGFEGQTELHATLKGPLKHWARIEAHITVPTLTASYQSLQVGNSGPIHIDYANSVLVIQPAEIKGTDSSLQFQGRIPLTGAAPMNVTAKGSVDLRLLQIVSPGIKSAGTIALDVNAQGTTGHPKVQGQVTFKDASLSTEAAPLGLSHANGTFDITTDQVRITQFTGQVGGGQISAGGTILYRPQIQFNMAVQAKSVRLLYPEGLRTVLDSNLNVTGSMKNATVGGRVLIDSLSFTPDFDLANFMGQFTGAGIPPTGESFADNVKLNVSVQSTGTFAATSSQVSLEGQANLRVIGTASDPVIVGRANLDSGDVFFLNNRYQLQQGVIMFNNPNETEPTVNLAVTTTIQQYDLRINVSGTIDKLQTSYVSDPPLSTVDIINLIARGETTEQADTTNLSADSLLAQGVASKLSSGVQKLAGLSSLSIDPLLGGSNGNPSARIALQQRVTKNFFFTFSTDVTQPQSEIIQGDYRFNKRWSVSVNRDAAGGVAVDGKFHTSF